MRAAPTCLSLVGLAAGLCPAGPALAQGAGASVTSYVANSPHAAGSSLGGLVTPAGPRQESVQRLGG